MDGRIGRPLDHRRTVLSGRDGPPPDVLAHAHPVFDGHSFDRLIGLRRDGAEGQPAGFFLVGFLRGAFGSAGLDSQGRLKASEAEASDE